MIAFGGVIYYFDIDALTKTISPADSKPTDKVTEIEHKVVKDNKNKLIGSETLETTMERGREIDGTKYDIIRLMIEVLIDYDEETDDTLGNERAFQKMPISYRLAFNTLYNYGILKEKEE